MGMLCFLPRRRCLLASANEVRLLAVNVVNKSNSSAPTILSPNWERLEMLGEGCEISCKYYT
jgi:hypothetical protein